MPSKTDKPTPTTDNDSIFVDDPNTPLDTPTVDFSKLRGKIIPQRDARDSAITDDEAQEMHNIDPDGAFFLDMSKAEDQIAPMMVGTMLVVSCTAAEAKISTSGNPMISLRVKAERVISTPVTLNDVVSYKNRSVRDNLMFISPNDVTGSRGTLWRAKQAIDAFGVEWDRGVYQTRSAFLDMLTRKAEELIGCVCIVELGIDDGTNNGQRAAQIDPRTQQPYPPKNTIARYYPYAPPAAKVNDEDLPF